MGKYNTHTPLNGRTNIDDRMIICTFPEKKIFFEIVLFPHQLTSDKCPFIQ